VFDDQLPSLYGTRHGGNGGDNRCDPLPPHSPAHPVDQGPSRDADQQGDQAPEDEGEGDDRSQAHKLPLALQEVRGQARLVNAA
jgi:hypothetical protein